MFLRVLASFPKGSFLSCMTQILLCDSSRRWPCSKDVSVQGEQCQWVFGGLQDGGWGHGEDPQEFGNWDRADLVLPKKVPEAREEDVSGEAGDQADHLEPDA